MFSSWKQEEGKFILSQSHKHHLLRLNYEAERLSQKHEFPQVMAVFSIIRNTIMISIQSSNTMPMGGSAIGLEVRIA